MLKAMVITKSFETANSLGVYTDAKMKFLAMVIEISNLRLGSINIGTEDIHRREHSNMH